VQRGEKTSIRGTYLPYSQPYHFSCREGRVSTRKKNKQVREGKGKKRIERKNSAENLTERPQTSYEGLLVFLGVKLLNLRFLEVTFTANKGQGRRLMEKWKGEGERILGV